jgi:hypothetical protein
MLSNKKGTGEARSTREEMRNVYNIFVEKPEGKVFVCSLFNEADRISEYRLWPGMTG